MEKNLRYIEKAKKFRAKKKLGQNFLVDEKYNEKIIETACLSPDETVIEIGAGLGFVTERLAQEAKKVIAIELDDDAVFELNKLPYSNINVVQQDILKTDFSQLVEAPVKLVANIPYYITSPILLHILGEIDQPHWKNRELAREIILMVQYEVAKRIIADEKSHSKEYGLLSILVNYWCRTEFICKVPAKSFYPAPKVDSAIVKLTAREEPAVKIENPALFRKVTQAAFGMRRKTLKNALVNNGFEAEKVVFAMEKAGIGLKQRGETLSIKEFSNLCSFL